MYSFPYLIKKILQDIFGCCTNIQYLFLNMGKKRRQQFTDPIYIFFVARLPSKRLIFVSCTCVFLVIKMQQDSSNVKLSNSCMCGLLRSSGLGVHLTEQCNTACDCDNIAYDPVCGSDQHTYFSPCHAGCLATSKDVRWFIRIHTQNQCFNIAATTFAMT